MASFYHGFHTEPRGEHTCTVCMGTACHVRGAPRLLEQVERDTGIARRRHDAGPLAAPSRRSAASAPALSGHSSSSTATYHGHMTADALSRMVGKLLEKEGPR